MTQETQEAPDVRERDGLPSLPPLYAKAASTVLLRRGGGLPNRRYAVRGLRLDQDDVAKYGQVTGFPLRSTLPITYPYKLGFPLFVQLMTDLAFPFSMVGMVHTRQVIEQRRAIGIDEPLDVEARAENLAAHRKGAQFDVVADVRVDGELVWTGRSTYLRPGGTSVVEQQAEQPPELSTPSTVRATWKVEEGTGRAYAGVAGDVNPIHLHMLTAKAFGFPKAIAHGMWTASRALAGLQGRLPEACAVDCRFTAPLLLPSTVRYATEHTTDGSGATTWSFAVLSKKDDGKPYVVGQVTPLG